MRTAVIIATHQRPGMVRRLLRNLAGGSRPPGLEVLVVENGPRCGVQAVVAEELGDIGRYLYRPVGNKSVALNHALAATEADLVIFLDDDIKVPAGIVTTYVDAAARHGPGAFFGGGLAPDAETGCPAHLLPYLPRSVRGWWYSDCEAEIPASSFDFFFGANWAAFRSDLAAAGRFSERLGVTASQYSPVGEETELQQRLVALGGKPVYLPDATILHPVPREHYTARWLAERRFRLGVAEWTVSHSGTPHRRLAGLPLWVLRRLAGRWLAAFLAAIRGGPIDVRTENRMEAAHLAGLLWGAWRDRPRRSPTRVVPGAKNRRPLPNITR